LLLILLSYNHSAISDRKQILFRSKGGNYLKKKIKKKVKIKIKIKKKVES
jgi:hypothetical protein